MSNLKEQLKKKWWSKQFFIDDGCPFCNNYHFMIGPSGGNSQNFTCTHCYSRFNDIGPFGIELIKGPDIPDFLLKEINSNMSDDRKNVMMYGLWPPDGDKPKYDGLCPRKLPEQKHEINHGIPIPNPGPRSATIILRLEAIEKAVDKLEAQVNRIMINLGMK